MLGLMQYPQRLGLFSRTTNTMLGLIQYPQGLGLFSHTTNMWQISNLQIDSSVIQIVQSDVLRNSIDTTATITNKVVYLASLEVVVWFRCGDGNIMSICALIRRPNVLTGPPKVVPVTLYNRAVFVTSDQTDRKDDRLPSG